MFFFHLFTIVQFQKKREMRAAGLRGGGGTYRVKRGRIDYNAEIPFEKRQPAGFHDPDADSFEKERFTKQTREQIDGERRDKKEAVGCCGVTSNMDCNKICRFP